MVFHLFVAVLMAAVVLLAPFLFSVAQRATARRGVRLSLFVCLAMAALVTGSPGVSDARCGLLGRGCGAAFGRVRAVARFVVSARPRLLGRLMAGSGGGSGRWELVECDSPQAAQGPARRCNGTSCRTCQ